RVLFRATLMLVKVKAVNGRDLVCPAQLFGLHLIHPKAGSKNPAAGIGNIVHLAGSLEGAIFPLRTMEGRDHSVDGMLLGTAEKAFFLDRKSTRLNSSH